MSQDLFDCYVSVTALNLRYHSADKITTDRLSKIARHNIYATLDRVQTQEHLFCCIFYSTTLFDFCQPPNVKKQRNQAVSKL